MTDVSDRKPVLTIAHRAGNNLDHLQRAEGAGVDFVEADVWLHRGQLEIRHEKTAGLLPILWDRWSLRSGREIRLLLSDLLRAAQPTTRLLLDLRGVNRGLPAMVKRVIYAAEASQPIAVCSQNWRFVDAFRVQPTVLRVYSIGSPRQLSAWQRIDQRDDQFALSIAASVLDERLVHSLHEQAEFVAPWGVRTWEQAEQLIAWGVTAINADDLQLLKRVRDGGRSEPVTVTGRKNRR